MTKTNENDRSDNNSFKKGVAEVPFIVGARLTLVSQRTESSGAQLKTHNFQTLADCGSPLMIFIFLTPNGFLSWIIVCSTFLVVWWRFGFQSPPIRITAFRQCHVMVGNERARVLLTNGDQSAPGHDWSTPQKNQLTTANETATKQWGS